MRVDMGRAALATLAALVAAGCSAGSTETSLGDPSGGSGVGAAAPLVVSPATTIEFSAQGSTVLVGGPVELTLSNPGDATLNWSATADADWVELSKFSGSLVGGDSTTLDVTLDMTGLVGLTPGQHESTIRFEDPIGGGNTERTVRLEWTAESLPLLVVEPTEPFFASGVQGGPFSPASKSYVVRNIGEVPASWAVSADLPWLQLGAPTSGTLAPGASATVAVSYNQNTAAALPVGFAEGSIVFENTSIGQSQTVEFALEVLPTAGALLVPTNSIAFTAQVGQALPAAQSVLLRNSGGSPIQWSAGINQPWLSVTPTTGSLNPGQSTTVQLGLTAQVGNLTAGTHNGALALVNTSNGNGNKSIPVTLTLQGAAAALTIAPAETAYFAVNGSAPATPAYKQYSLTNTGGQPLTWTAAVNQNWIGLSSTGGTLQPGAQATLAVNVLSGPAGALPAGMANGSVAIANTTNGVGNGSVQVQVSKGDKGSLALNLAEVTYYSTELPYVDLFRTADKWLSQEVVGSAWNNGLPVATDANGWVSSLQPNQAAAVLVAAALGGNYPAGVYTLLFDGKGTFSVAFDGKVAQVEPGRILVTVNPSNAGILIKLLTTDPTDPARNIRLIMPGHEATHQTDIWNPAFLEAIQPFAGLRFMDWQRTNNSKLSQWSDRTTPANFTQASENGVSLEHMVALCNLTQKDAWFCMPHLADNNFVANFATYVRDNLHPTLTVYVELSNEVWNTSFTQGQWCQDNGVALNLANTPYEARLRFYSQRAVEMFDIWTSVFGTQSSRLVRTLAGQSVSTWTGQVALDWKQAYTKTDAYAIAPYFGGQLGDPSQVAMLSTMDANDILDWCETNIVAMGNHMLNNVAMANQRDVDLLAYEGGQHLAGHTGQENNNALTAKFIEANRHPRMHDLYLDYFARWKNAGGKLFFHYHSVGAYSKWGSWGSLENLNIDKGIQSPKYSAMTEFIAANPVWW